MPKKSKCITVNLLLWPGTNTARLNSTLTNCNAQKAVLGAHLLNKLEPLVTKNPNGKLDNGHPLVWSGINPVKFLHILTPYSSQNSHFRVWLTKQTWPPGGQKSKCIPGYLLLWSGTHPTKFHHFLAPYNALNSHFSVWLTK